MKDYGLPFSAALHALLITGAIFAMPAAAPFAPAVESLPVEIITPEQFDAIAKGEETAERREEAQTKVEKVAPEKAAKTADAPKVAEEATTPTPPSPPKRAIPDPVQADADPEPTPEPPARPTPPKQVAKVTPPAEKSPPPPPEKSPPPPPQKVEVKTPPQKTPPPPPEKVVEKTPPKLEPKVEPKADPLDELALRLSREEPAEKPEPKSEPKKPAKAEKPEPKVEPKHEPVKTEQAKAEPKTQDAEKPDPKADPKAIKKLLAGLKTDGKVDAKADSKSDSKAEKTEDGAADAKPTRQAAFDPKSILKTLGKHPTTVAAKKAAADGADAPDALASKEAPSRTKASGEKPMQTASLGKPEGAAPKLSLSERNALVGAIRQQVNQCWSRPIGSDPKALITTISFDLNQNGTLAARPTSAGGTPAAAGAAVRAVMQCVTASKPLKLPPNLYAHWQGIDVVFDPSR